MGEYVCNEIEKSLFEQKHAVRIVFSKDKLTHSNLLFENLNGLNAYQINIYQHSNFMHKFISKQIPSIFSNLKKRPDHKYPRNFSQSSFYLKRYYLYSTKYSFFRYIVSYIILNIVLYLCIF